MAIASLALSIISLMVYVSIIEKSSIIVFLTSTTGAFIASIVSLGLGLVAWKRIRQEEARSRNKLLVIVSIVVAVGYMVCTSIVMLSILVHWVI